LIKRVSPGPKKAWAGPPAKERGQPGALGGEQRELKNTKRIFM